MKRHIQSVTKESGEEFNLGIDDPTSNKHDATFFTFLSGMSIGGSLCPQSSVEALECFGMGLYFAIPALYLGLRVKETRNYQTI